METRHPRPALLAVFGSSEWNEASTLFTDQLSHVAIGLIML